MGNKKSLAAGAAAALVVLVIQPLTGSAATVPGLGAAHVTVPALTVPSVTTPSVTTPAVTAPSVSTPVLTVPAVTTPSVSTPSVSTPSVSTPSVSTPSVSTPAVSRPAVSTPSVTTPAVPAPSASGAAGRSAASGNAAPSPAAAAASSPALAGAGAAPGGEPRATQDEAVLNRSPGNAATGASGGSDPRLSRPRQRAATGAAAEDHRLRSLVARLRGCLGALDPGSRRLLSLRAGLSGPPLSVGAVAHVLHVSVVHEGRLERRSLQRLAGKAGTGCAPAAAPQGRAGADLTSQGTSPSPSGSPPSSSSAPTGPAARSPRRGHDGSVVVVTPAATRTVERAQSGGQGIPGAAIATFATLVLGVCLLALPGVRRRVIPVSGQGAERPPGGTARTMPAPARANERVSAPSRATRPTARPARTAEPKAPGPQRKPHPHYLKARPLLDPRRRPRSPRLTIDWQDVDPKNAKSGRPDPTGGSATADGRDPTPREPGTGG